MESTELTCTVSIERVDSSGATLGKSTHKNAVFVLGRNEFQEIIIKLDVGKRDFNYVVRDLILHRKFAKDGKATIKLPGHKVQFLLSNCPPDSLLIFLKTLSAKYTLKQGAVIGDRKKLLSDMPRTFQGISPLSVKDVNSLQQIRSQKETKNNFKTPNGKRKRIDGEDKENLPAQGLKIARKLIASPRSMINPVKLTPEQNRVLNTIQSGKSIFFTGSAGTGKSFLLKRIVGILPPQHTFTTASTGVAACQIGGTTLHAFAGMGGGTGSLEQCVQLASRSSVIQQWKKCRHLIIDEISMIDGDFFSKMETVARTVKRSEEPFGGIQLILCGDFLQLPPVSKGQDKKKFCFQSSAWRKCVQVNMELKNVQRQSDKKFINILQNIRLGRCPEEIVQELLATSTNQIDKDGILATRLCTHKEDVNEINRIHLEKLEGKIRAYEASDSDPMLVKQMNSQCPVSQMLHLKVGSQVMLAKNLDIQRGLVNGARGVVTDFEKGELGFPIVRFMCGIRLAMKPIRWTIKANGGMFLTRKQLPLQLAWAISIHKSQGMSLDCVELSLSRVFESGQAYVALSRATSLEGLRIVDFDKNCVRANPDVIKFYKRLHIEQSHIQGSIKLI